MKELSEYTAEVMRRADGKKRSRRRAAAKALSLGVPLAFAAAALILLPGLKPDTPLEAALPTFETSDAAPAEPAAIEVFVEPMDRADSLNYGPGKSGDSEPTEAAASKEAIAAIIASVTEGEELGVTETLLGGEGYLITVKCEDGSTVRYALEALTLTDLDRGIGFRVSEEQYETLLGLIRGITGE